MKYAALLELRATHSFYRNGRCPDVMFVPTPQTETLLRNHRCQIRRTPGSLTVKIAVDENGDAFLPLPATVSLRFMLEPKNGEFERLTDLSDIRAVMEAVEDNKKVRLFPTFTNTSLPAGTDGVLSIAWSKDATLSPAALPYIDVTLTNSVASAKPSLRSHQLGFSARSVRWVYYCVTDNAAVAATLSIADTPLKPGQTPEDPISGNQSGMAPASARVVFPSDSTTVFDGSTTPWDPICAALLEQRPGQTIVRFVSDPVACREQPRRHITLLRGEAWLTENLPAAERSSSIALSESNASAPEEALVHIIEYHTETTTTTSH